MLQLVCWITQKREIFWQPTGRVQPVESKWSSPIATWVWVKSESWTQVLQHRCSVLWLTVVVRKDEQGLLLQGLADLIIRPRMLSCPMCHEHQSPAGHEEEEWSQTHFMHTSCTIFKPSEGVLQISWRGHSDYFLIVANWVGEPSIGRTWLGLESTHPVTR